MNTDIHRRHDSRPDAARGLALGALVAHRPLLAAITVMLERLWFFIQERAPRERLAPAMAALRKDGPAAALGKLEGARSMEAAVARACLEQAPARRGSRRRSARRGRRAGARALREAARVPRHARQQRAVRRTCSAPCSASFARSTISPGGSMQNSQLVMAGIAEALVATGVGLIVALPAVAALQRLRCATSRRRLGASDVDRARDPRVLEDAGARRRNGAAPRCAGAASSPRST